MKTRITFFNATLKLVPLSLCCMLLFFSCHGDGKKKTSVAATTSSAAKTAGDQIKMLRNSLKAQQIYPIYLNASTYSSQEYVCVYAISPGNKAPENLYLYGDSLVQFYAAKVQSGNSGKATVLNKRLLMEAEWTYCALDSNSQHVEIAGDKYLYFSYRTEFMGTAVREKNIGFRVVNLNDLTSEEITYTGTESQKCEDCLEGSFGNTQNLKRKPEILAFLRQKAAEHRNIYHPSKKDKDIYHVINYQTKWERDNQADNHMANGHGDINPPVKTTLYATDLFALQKGTEIDVAENDQYLFKSYFSGSIIGYNKLKKMFFPLMIEDCHAMCSKKISIAEGVLKISYGEDEDYEVPLSQIVFDTRTGHQ